jgi:hypothetical protein
LDKFCWNIECSLKIMDLLNIHLKDLLNTISCSHIQHIQQHQQFISQQQQQQQQSQQQQQPQYLTITSAPNPLLISTTTSSTANSTYTTQLIFKLEELLNTLINVSMNFDLNEKKKKMTHLKSIKYGCTIFYFFFRPYS